MAESYRKRIYPKHFFSNLTDFDGENSETQVRIEFSFSCKYISKTIYQELISESLKIGKLINYTILSPENFGVKNE